MFRTTPSESCSCGTLRCGVFACVFWLHTATGGSGALAADSAPQKLTAEKPDRVTEHCATESCHAGITDRKVMHGPVAQKKCMACHAYDEPREHRFKLASPLEKLCIDCHTLQNRTVVHTPLKQGRCTGCHDAHGSDHKRLLVADAAKGLCISCHKQDARPSAAAASAVSAGNSAPAETVTSVGLGKKYLHGPVASGACILCHEAHSSWQPKLLVDKADKLCLNCHAEVIPTDERGRHVHAPLKEGCSGCHDAHASDYKFQLRQAAPDMCTSCHKELRQTLASSAVVHGAVTQANGCTTCHAPHTSSLPKLQRALQPQSCLTNCHDHPLKTADGRTLTDMAALLKSSPQHHGPIREGACTACHQPHAANRFRLLTAEYPPEFYAGFKLELYALCFNCHIPDVVLKKEGVGLTRFRQGELNLHWLHVNREKGRTCRACHEVHASTHPFHVRDAVPFGNGGWMLEIKYEQTPTGGTCSPGCHKPMTYDHGGAKPLPSTWEVKNAPASTN